MPAKLKFKNWVADRFLLLKNNPALLKNNHALNLSRAFIMILLRQEGIISFLLIVSQEKI